MQTTEVPPRSWARTLDAFSAMHEGWLVSVDVLQPTLGAQPQIRDLPLRGISSESGSRDPIITISAARADGEFFTHIIHSPSSVRIAKTDEGADVALEIESEDGTASIVRLKTATLPETVDGVVRER